MVGKQKNETPRKIVVVSPVVFVHVRLAESVGSVLTTNRPVLPGGYSLLQWRDDSMRGPSCQSIFCKHCLQGTCRFQEVPSLFFDEPWNISWKRDLTGR